ncbi:MAG TPA: PQQ-dependent sugar dehydrogenase [Thermoanaerobaculia bacterium]|nr:PQQ-dependent sugar dehydrogenase [Thermoanaerobaculia bacterium]
MPALMLALRPPTASAAALATAICLLCATPPAPAGAQGLALDTSLLVSGLVRPLGIVDPGDGSGRLFVVEQDGRIRIWKGAALEPAPFLDLSAAVECCGERGLLGLAFHPGYAVNGTFFVNYTRTELGQLQTVISRFSVSGGDPDVAEPASEHILLTVDQPNANHNAGDLAFGPDGYLYVPLGDGGGGGDPGENGQDLSTLLGSILRIDVDSPPDPGLAYAVPSDNPFVGVAGARPEIWAHGLRNPFRVSFDRATGDLWIGDVGQNAWEEIDLQPASSAGGENYGWDCREGAHDYPDPNGDLNATCTGTGYTDPVLEYAHEDAGGGFRCSVTGGYRYRGDVEPRLRGVYLYADFCSGEIFGTVPRCDGAWESRVLVDAGFNITAFGQDAGGELYVTERVDDENPVSAVHRLVLAVGSGGPDLRPSPATLDFGAVEAGDTVTLLLTLENDNPGPEAAAVTARTLSDPARFAMDFGAGTAPCRSAGRPCLPPGASCTMAIRLQAYDLGAISQTLAFDGNFAAETVSLQAEVVPCASDVDLDVTGLTVGDGETESRRACDTLTAGPDVTVEAGGGLTLRAGTRIVLASGVRVESGGSLALEIF